MRTNTSFSNSNHFPPPSNRVNRTGIPYKTGAAPFKYLKLQTSLELAIALANVGSSSTPGDNSFLIVSRPNFWNTVSENLSISLSVTSHKLATSAGLNAD